MNSKLIEALLLVEYYREALTKISTVQASAEEYKAWADKALTRNMSTGADSGIK